MATITDDSSGDVHLGSWMDRSKGVVEGANITLTSTNGVILVAFIALFVQFAGQHLWGIACFGWHQLRVTHRPKTALQYQQDASLRNNASPGQTLWHLLQIAWSWRKARGRYWWRTAAFPVLIPLLFQFLISATGIVSSMIVETSDVQVLLRGDKCGIWQTPSQDAILAADNQFMVENQRYIGAVKEFSRIYARACYNSGNADSKSQNTPNCQAFARKSIPYSTHLNASCPFDANTCIFPEGNLRMDTAEFDTNQILGINTGKHSIKFRKVTTCAPLKPDFYTTRENLTGSDGNPEYEVRWHWGTLNYIGYDYIAEAESSAGQPFAGYTMITPNHYLTDPRLDYPDQSSFTPIKEFNVTNGDIQMMFLTPHDMVYAAPVEDPWFSAHRGYVTDYNRTQYRADNLMSPMGCVEQFTFCNAQKTQCTPLTGILPAAAEAKHNIGFDSMQSAIVDLIVNAIYASNANIAQPVVMLAAQAAVDGLQLPLPNDQWILELQDMHNRALTQLQRTIVDYARGPGSATAQQFLVVPNEESKELCSTIRARTTGRFSNVNVYGLAFTLAIGGLIILVNLFLVDIVAAIQKRRKVDPLKRDTWVADGLFQLQKESLDLNDHGPWRNTDKSVPVTDMRGLVARKPFQDDTVSFHSRLPTGRGSTEKTDVESAVEHVEVREERRPETPKLSVPATERIEPARPDAPVSPL